MSESRRLDSLPRTGALWRPSPVIAAIGIVVLVAAWTINPNRFLRAYFVAFNYWVGLSLGCLVLLMVQHLTGGRWGIIARRVQEATARLLPLTALFFVPIALGLPKIFAWTNPEFLSSDASLAHKANYLNTNAFLLRAVIYYVIWILLSIGLNRWSRDEEEGQPRLAARRMRSASGLGLVLYGLTITFASVDWIMSLEPRWYSTMFPPLYAVGQILEGIAFTTLIVIGLRQYSSIAAAISPLRLRDFGNLTLVLIMFWAYLGFSQFLLIWAENLPEEIPWYLHRVHGNWQVVAVLLIVLQFALPFVLLLSRDIKERPGRLAAVVIIVLAMRFVDLVWWIEASYGEPVSFSLLFDVAAWLGMGAIWLWRFGMELQKMPLLPPSGVEMLHVVEEETVHG